MTEEQWAQARASWRREKLASMAWGLIRARFQGRNDLMTPDDIRQSFYEADMFLAEVEKREI